MSLVYDQFKIDSIRFQTSNLYYMSTIDLYREIFEDAKANLEKQKTFYEEINNRRDSIKSDSLGKVREKHKKKFEKLDSLKAADLEIKTPI
jgi:cysteinyl-tRNA synthetase